MDPKPGPAAVGSVGRCRVLPVNQKQHLPKAGQQNRAWREQKCPGRKPHWPLTWQTPVLQHQLLWDLPAQAAWILGFCSAEYKPNLFSLKEDLSAVETRCSGPAWFLEHWLRLQPTPLRQSRPHSWDDLLHNHLRVAVLPAAGAPSSTTLFPLNFSTKCAWIQQCENSQLLQPRPVVSYPPCGEHRRSPAPCLCSLLNQTETI